MDIGTNSVHMLIVRVDGELKFQTIDRAKEMVHLGRGSFETGRLDEGAQKRALKALTMFRRLAERRGVERFIAVATSAVREASNGGAFLQEVYDATGIHAKIISGVEEARLVFRGIQDQVAADDDAFLVCDLGGGSADFACGTARQFNWSSSLKLGARRLESVALNEGEVTRATRRALKDRLRKELAPVIKRAKASGAKQVYLTAGSATHTLKLLEARGSVPTGKNQITRKAVAAFDDELAGLSRAKRGTIKGLDPERIDMVVPAVALFRELADELGAEAMMVSDRGLREGIVLDFIDRHAADLQWDITEPNARRRAVLRFAERFHYDAAHAHHVAHLAISLFDATKELHGLDEAARELLEYGALVHDAGYAISEKGHHRHSEYLILHGLNGGFSDPEVRLIAAIARYHRKVAPHASHKNFKRLTAEQQETVRRAASLLRIADGLDRSHARAVTGLRCEITKTTLRIHLQTQDAVDLERWAAKRKADVFEKVFRRTVELKAEPATVPIKKEIPA